MILLLVVTNGLAVNAVSSQEQQQWLTYESRSEQ